MFENILVAGITMETLKEYAIYTTTYIGKKDYEYGITIPNLIIPFSRWTGEGLSQDVAGSYHNKTLFELEGEPVFGELAVLRLLQKDGWDGVWVDTYHGRGKKLFWKGLPDRSKPFFLPTEAEELYDKIVYIHGKPGGFFDVFAWRNGKFLFIEYKSMNDKLGKNQVNWIESAIKAGVDPDSLLLVTHKKL